MQATKCRTSHRPAALIERPTPSRKRPRPPRRKPSDRVLRERVAYMLWVMAQQME
jgi:hypothetical protein